MLVWRSRTEVTSSPVGHSFWWISIKTALNLVSPSDKDLFFPYGLFFAPEGALRVKNRGLFPVPNWSPRKVVRPEQQLRGIYAWDLSKENYLSKPSLLSIKQVLGMARTGIFCISLLCIFSFVPGGGRAPWTVLVDFSFPSDGSSQNCLIFPKGLDWLSLACWEYSQGRK